MNIGPSEKAQPWPIVHASDEEVRDERVARAVDLALGAGAWAQVSGERAAATGGERVGAADGPGAGGVAVGGGVEAARANSAYEVLFSEADHGRSGRRGRPVGANTIPRGEFPTHVVNEARRRADRVLKHLFAEERGILMRLECEYLSAVDRDALLPEGEVQ